MNVYVDSLASALARAGVDCDVFVRAEDPRTPRVVEVEPGYRVVQIDAGPRAPLPKEKLFDHVDEFIANARGFIDDSPLGYDVLHAHYWVSGAVAHRLKHELSLPLVATFHTLARVKAEAGFGDESDVRAIVEHEVVRCSDLIVASTPEEQMQLDRLYGADAHRIETVPPGVDHTVFRPGRRDRDRDRLLLDGRKVVLFAGRIQPLKGADLAIRTIAALRDPAALLLLVGGPSGADGEAEMSSLVRLVDSLGVRHQVRFVDPVPHRELAAYYRAADVCLVPSRTESFGLVALEAAACGTPVVASAVGGLRSLVDHATTGFLVEGRDPADYAAPIAALFADGAFAAEMSANALAGAGRYSWSITAARLRRLYTDLAAAELVTCR
jgi:D-inositol-3-phosphate glycosyltransferase